MRIDEVEKNLKHVFKGIYGDILECLETQACIYDAAGRVLHGYQFEERFGISLDAVLGRSAMYLVEQGFADKTPISNVLQTRESAVIEQKTATGRQIRVKAVPFKDDDGEIAFIVESCTDISELEKMRSKLKKVELEVERYRAESSSLKKLEGELMPQQFDAIRFIPNFEEKIMKVANTNATMLILGESGTGKTHLACKIHKNSQRASGPFISINCSTIADNLFESELFGYAPGAFTGAKNKGKNGLVDLANGGTLFLDEIGEVPLHLQGKLLELIQEKRYIPVGALRYKSVDVKIITATNQNLKELVERKRFREDLYYRLRVVEFEVPPLRERKDAIEAFVNYFLNLYNNEYNSKKVLSQEVRHVLLNYEWPGNIRELKNLLHSLIIMSIEDEIRITDLPETAMTTGIDSEGPVSFGDLDELMEQHKREIVERCFRLNPSSRKLAAALNMSQTKAIRLMKKYGLKRQKKDSLTV